MTKYDIIEVLKLYNLGTFERVIKVYKDDAVSFGIRVKTSSNDLFIKEFHNFNYKKENSLDLINFLNENQFPVIKLFKSVNNTNYVNFNDKQVAVFEFLDIEEKTELNSKEVFELAKNLAKLHSLIIPPSITLGKNNYPASYGKRTISNHYLDMAKAPENFKIIISYVYDYFNNLKIPKTEPKSICHLEFTQEHARFRNNKLIAILDWDEANVDYSFYDIGNAMLSCFDEKNFNFNKLNSFIDGYKSIKDFTSWQKNHLFELVHFGAAMNCVWNLTNMQTGKLCLKNKWPEDMKRIEILMKIEKNQFFNIM